MPPRLLTEQDQRVVGDRVGFVQLVDGPIGVGKLVHGPFRSVDAAQPNGVSPFHHSPGVVRNRLKA